MMSFIEARIVETSARIYAEYARVQGMMAENMQRQAVGNSMAFTLDNFEIAASKIENMANQIHELSERL